MYYLCGKTGRDRQKHPDSQIASGDYESINHPFHEEADNHDAQQLKGHFDICP